MSKLEIVEVRIDLIKPYKLNAKIHPESQIVTLMDSIREYGWIDPVLLSNPRDNDLIAGHGRLEAGKRLERETCPAIYLEHLSERQVRALRLAHNKTNELGHWDFEKLSQEMAELAESGMNLSLTAFDEQELDAMLSMDPGAMPTKKPSTVSLKSKRATRESENPMTFEDHALELVEKWGVADGQVWHLGAHRVACGDAREMSVYTRLMRSKKAQLIHTDPPYGVEYISADGTSIKNDDLKRDALTALVRDSMVHCRENSVATAAFYIWHATMLRKDFDHALAAVGLVERQYIVWAKEGFALGRADYHWQSEFCYYAEKDGERCDFFGDRKQTTVWKLSRVPAGENTFSIGTGVVISDGEGEEIYVVEGMPKSKKARHVRVTSGESLDLAVERPVSDCWQIARTDRSKYMHPNQKPPEIPETAIRNSSRPGDVVLDPFVGSGETLIACETLGRKCRAIDLDPKWVAVTIERWHRLTGKKPILDRQK